MKRKQALHAAIGFILTVGICGNATAGQYKTLNTTGLAKGAQLTAFSSPKNSGTDMEMEVYEWQSAGDCYRCGIVNNNTGANLTISLISQPDQTDTLTSCTANYGSSCNTLYLWVPAGKKPLCIISSTTLTSSSINSYYRMSVTRWPYSDRTCPAWW